MITECLGMGGYLGQKIYKISRRRRRNYILLAFTPYTLHLIAYSPQGGPHLLHGLPDLREDIPAEGLVLGLVLEAQLIGWDHLWVQHSLQGSSRTVREFLAMCQLGGGWFGRTFAVFYGIVTTRRGQMCEANTMLLR